MNRSDLAFVRGDYPRDLRRNSWIPVVLVVASLAAHGMDAFAQEVLRTHDAVEVGATPGWPIGLGDINGDLLPDYAIAGRGIHALGGLSGVAAFDGPTGTRIWFTVHRTYHSFTLALNTVGDLDADGVLDIAVCSGNVIQSPGVLGDVCTFLSGRTGSYLSEIQGSEFSIPASSFESVHGLDDINGDGVPDVLLQWSSGAYRVYSGAPGHSLIYLVPGASTQSWDQEVLGDLNGDGLRDYAIRYSSFAQGPIMNVYSAATGQILYVLPGSRYVAAASDLDGDGVRDFATAGDPAILIGYLYYGRVEMRSGVDGSILWTTISPLATAVGNQLGLDMQSGGDVNGDGYHDIFSLDNPFSNGVIGRVLSGRTGAILMDIERNDLRSSRGCVPARFEMTRVLGDLDGDGYAEFAASDPVYSECGTRPLVYRGRIYIFRGGPGGETERLCDASPNSSGDPARLRQLGAPQVGSPTLGWQLYDAPAQEFSQLVFGPALAPGAPPITIGSGLLCFGAQGAQRIGTPVQTDIFGIARFDANWTNPTIATGWTAGTTWVLQTYFRDTPHPIGANTSNALLTSFY